MFRWFKKTKKSLSPSCINCLHYGCVRSDDKLNPDKTISKGKLEYEFCLKGDFYLTDYMPCELYKELCVGDKRSAGIMPPPKPPLYKD